VKVVFAIVWLLSSGKFEGEPWQLFSDMTACQAYRETRQVPATRERLLFFEGCLDTAVAGNVEFLRFDLKKEGTK
jgi:hypothetical protein